MVKSVEPKPEDLEKPNTEGNLVFPEFILITQLLTVTSA